MVSYRMNIKDILDILQLQVKPTKYEIIFVSKFTVAFRDFVPAISVQMCRKQAQST